MPILKKHKNPLIVMVGELVLLVVFFGYAASLFFPPSPAKATSGMGPFGGKILGFVLATATPPCPPHSVVLDYRSNMIIGIYLTPNSRV
ncbi:MAG: hypothetical protein NTX98_00805, partial [Candidatus Doudnabacteria bacterium]|nr:hypothetical protein [Candidatus Doudnabacteria bacterium]